MRTLALQLTAMGFLGGTVSAVAFFSSLQERQLQEVCPQLPRLKDERIPIADIRKAVEGLPLNGTGANLGQTPVAEKPEVKVEVARNFDKLVSIAPNNTAMFQYQAVVNRLAHPWNTIGKVWVYGLGGVTQCTGTLVARNIILTASHCVPRSSYLVEFAPAYDGTSSNPRPFGTAYSSNCIDIGVPLTPTPNGLDYKVCQLRTDIGRRTGTMGYIAWTNDAPYLPPAIWTSVGYPLAYAGGAVPVVQQAIRIDDVDNQSDGTKPYCGKQLEEYSVYASAGWDGGPMFKVYPGGGAAIAGVVSGNEKEGRIAWDFPTNTLHAGGVCMLELILYAISIWATP